MIDTNKLQMLMDFTHSIQEDLPKTSCSVDVHIWNFSHSEQLGYTYRLWIEDVFNHEAGNVDELLDLIPDIRKMVEQFAKAWDTKRELLEKLEGKE